MHRRRLLMWRPNWREKTRDLKAWPLLRSRCSSTGLGRTRRMSFKDYFSKQAADYAKFRPRYPQEMFEYLGSIAPSRKLVGLRHWKRPSGSGTGGRVRSRHRNGCEREADRERAVTRQSRI